MVYAHYKSYQDYALYQLKSCTNCRSNYIQVKIEEKMQHISALIAYNTLNFDIVKVIVQHLIISVLSDFFSIESLSIFKRYFLINLSKNLFISFLKNTFHK